MSVKSLIAGHFSASLERRISPVSCFACLMTFGLLVIGITASIATGFMLASLPNIIMFIVGALIIDVLLIRFAPKIHLVEAAQSTVYGVLYLAITSVCAVLAAYALQRFAFPLRDQMLENIDLTMGFSWPAYVRWIDKHPFVQVILHAAYYSIWVQSILPVVILSFSHRTDEARRYLLSFSLALTATLAISALLPAVGPIVFSDRASFDIIRFTGATPFDQLIHLRETGPLIQREFPGGIATFPSFHATMAILTPLALRRYPRIFVVLLILDAAMLASTISEGAHYFIDIIAGSLMAFLAYALAKHLLRVEDRLFNRRSDLASRPHYAPAKAIEVEA
jgi:membrane-associated phospholipid phosphatase